MTNLKFVNTHNSGTHKEAISTEGNPDTYLYEQPYGVVKTLMMKTKG